MKEVYTSKTKNKGKGLFAGENIKKGELIFKFKGKIIKKYRAYDSKAWIGSRWLGIGKALWLDTSKNNPGYYINHSCNPNTGIQEKLNVIAMKDIKKGEELTFDYSISEEDPYWKMKCNCGSKNCRKIIRDIASLPKKTFNKYKNYMPEYFLKIYNK